ncbi:hypothetical protein [Yinghuangia sp. YIM S10712]|uniref:hypothetical protein n=1 Tax=Yinghuangia sp. YIM S10712 TaxID=3436930 RepID=UPI003F5395FF
MAVAVFLAAGCGGGGDDKQDPSRPPAAGQSVGGAGADGSGEPQPENPEQGTKLAEAHSFEEIAALLKPALGPCQRLMTTGHPLTELNAADKARGGTQKAVCFYQEQQFSLAFLLIDADNSTFEAFHKQHDIYSSEQAGMGFTVELVGSANDEVEADVAQQLKLTGLPFLNCEQDFAPHDGVQVTEAKTPGCRYTPTPRY